MEEQVELESVSSDQLCYSIVDLCHFYFAVRNKLKTMDTIGNCQRPVFSLSVSQHA